MSVEPKSSNLQHMAVVRTKPLMSTSRIHAEVPLRLC